MTSDSRQLPDQSDVQALIRAGDELRDMLRGAPGIDVMRSAALQEWKAAKAACSTPTAVI